MTSDGFPGGSHRPSLPRLAVVMGDPAGIGAEIIVKCLRVPDIYEVCLPLVIGDERVLRAAPGFAAQDMIIQAVNDPGQAQPGPHVMSLTDLHNVPDTVQIGRASAEGGRAALAYLSTAVRMALAGQVAAIVFAPLNKEAMKKGGLHHADEYGFLSEISGGGEQVVVVVGQRFVMATVSLHVPIKDVAASITRARVLATIRCVHRAALMNNVARPRLAVLALNPHAGEHGLMGEEDEREIRPAVEAAAAEGMDVTGPLPADTAFLSAREAPYDGYVGMYHDQGRIPLKLLDFGHAITTGEGLPYVVCTPSHGTAYDIAGRGIARHENMLEAILYAAKRAAAGKAPDSGARL